MFSFNLDFDCREGFWGKAIVSLFSPLREEMVLWIVGLVWAKQIGNRFELIGDIQMQLAIKRPF